MHIANIVQDESVPVLIFNIVTDARCCTCRLHYTSTTTGNGCWKEEHNVERMLATCVLRSTVNTDDRSTQFSGSVRLAVSQQFSGGSQTVYCSSRTQSLAEFSIDTTQVPRVHFFGVDGTSWRFGYCRLAYAMHFQTGLLIPLFERF